MKKRLLVLSLFLSAGLISCEDGQPVEEKGLPMDPHGTISVEMSTQHYTGYDVLTTNKLVRDNQGIIVKTIISYDTLPDLGPTRDTLDTGNTFTDSDDNEHEIDTIITHSKDYKLYITVKK